MMWRKRQKDRESAPVFNEEKERKLFRFYMDGKRSMPCEAKTSEKCDDDDNDNDEKQKEKLIFHKSCFPTWALLTLEQFDREIEIYLYKESKAEALNKME